MSQKSIRLLLLLISILTVLIYGPALGVRMAALAASARTPDPVTAAWAKARSAGSYHFASDITQMTIPVAKVTNVGHQSRTEHIRLEGDTNLRENRLEMQLWSEGGSILQHEDGVSVKIEDGKSYIRRGAGAWQESEGALDSIAPQGDFMAYLAAVRDVKAGASESRAGIQFTRYSFALDGPSFAAFMRDQMEAALRAKGELPPSVNLDLPPYYRDMTGDGELWVGEDGLPLRQILNINFPEQREQTISAQIVVDFSQFGKRGQSLASMAQGQDGWLAGLGLQIQDFGLVFTLLSMTSLAGIMLYYRRARLLQTAVAAGVIASLVVGPLLTTFKIDAFFAAQAAKAAAHEETQAAIDAQRDLSHALGRPEFNPQANPMETGDQRLETGVASPAPSPLVSGLQSPNLQTTDDGTDTDGDGLSDFVEMRIGTDSENPDSDGDGVSDRVEVVGFTLGGQTWYGDAQNFDSNNDGISDGQEWDTDGDGQPDDTDSDGVPDTFDPDNDNDGVPDRLDLSSFSVSAIFGDATPFQLTINQLTANMPTFVDFQVRPTNPEHLWYAFNVLDWPINDADGQVQDIDGKHFADLAVAQGRTPTPSDAFGDMKLIPMLEIRIQGAVTNLPPQSDLIPYNISVNDYDADGNIKLVYVPLSLVMDNQTGQRVAFNGRMRYLPTGSWPAPQDIRMVWVVQALVDQPCDRDAPNAAQQGCAADGYVHNVPQMVQAYYDNWRLTGLNISEQHGTKTAVIYEDPVHDGDYQDNASLIALAHGLENSFLAGRDQDGNGVRDVTINDLVGRFDHTQNSGATFDQRWGLDNELNILRIERYDYATIDHATVHTAMTTTLSLLNNQFNAEWEIYNTLKPTLMYVYEQYARSLSLDAATTPGGYVSLQANGVVANMLGSGPSPVTVNITAGVKWTHYCRTDNTVAWTACAADVYWDDLDQRYADSAAFPGDPDDPEVAAGRQMVLHLYDLSLTQGVNRVVQLGDQLVPTAYNPKNDAATASVTRDALQQGAVPTIKFLTNQVVMGYYKDKIKAVKGLGIIARAIGLSQAASKAAFYLKNIKTNPLAGTGIVLGAAVVGTGLAVGLTYLVEGYRANNDEARIAVKSLSLGLTFLLSVAGPVVATAELAKGGFAAQALAAKPDLISNSRMASAIGAALAIGVTWGFFIYNVISNDLAPNSIEFNLALAETIAATIYIILLTIVSSTVIGLILVGFLALTDGILTLVCELGTDSLRGAGGACFTVAGAAVNAIASAFYGHELMVETNNKDLIVPGAPHTTLADPNKGFVAGNDLAITLPITNHVLERSVSDDLGTNYAYFTINAARRTTFKYSLTQPNPVAITDVEQGQMGNAWLRFEPIGVSEYYGTRYGGYARTTPAPVSGFNLQPGLNRVAPFHLNVGYALPAFDCWKIWVLSGSFPFFKKVSACNEQTVKGNSSTKIETLLYDIFPSTVNGFMTLGAKSGGGQGLSWDARFPALRDADGDGLMSPAFGGLDPNDAKSDTDNDGLADAFELERRAAGQPYELNACDTDGDGLTDGQEAAFGSNPAQRDSDNDGLSDADEIWHQVYNVTTCQPTSNWSGGWNITMNAETPFTIRVSSNPFTSDSDGDSISDLAERQLAGQVDAQNQPYHPGVPNTPPLVVYTASDKTFIAPGESLIYTTTVMATTALAPGVLDVVVPAQLGGSPSLYNLDFDPLTFDGSQTVVRQTSLSAQPGLSTQNLAVSSNAQTRLAPTGPSTLVWEPLTFQSLGSAPALRFIVPTVSTIDRQDSYLIATQTSTSDSRNGTGAVLAHVIPGGASATLFSSSLPNSGMGAEPPDIACNNNRVCLAVWSYRDHTNGSYDALRGVIIRADGQVQSNVAFPVNVSTNHYYPQVASDGVDFLVASEKTDGLSTHLAIQRVNASGAVVSDQSSEIERPRIATASTNSVALDLAWLGNRYGLVWKFIRPRGGAALPGFYTGVIDRNGAPIGSLATLFGTNGIDIEWDASGAPAIAYDPVNDRTLVLYKSVLSNNVAAFLFPGSNITTWNNVKWGWLGPMTGDHGFIANRPPRVAFNPLVNGWLVFTAIASTGITRLLSPDLTQQLINIQVIMDANDMPVACPAVSSLPVADLRFEELPGATAFANSSVLTGNPATCSGDNCPAAGLPGATDAQGAAVGGGSLGWSSDYSVRFDGGNDELILSNPLGNEFSLAFWYKAQPTTGGAGFAIESGPRIDSGQPSGFALFLYNNVNLIEFDAGGVSIEGPSPTPVADGQWHFVVATRSSNGAMAVYVDGNPTPILTSPTSAAPVMGSTIRLGYGDTTVQLDNFQLYKTALNGTTVQTLYNRTAQSYCIGVNNYRWARVNATRPDTRGGKLAASSALTITVDADKPSAAISGLTSGQWIMGNTVHTIGGTASDPTSGVARVEIQVDNDPAWLPVSGAASWAYNLPVIHGQYLLKVRAIDAVGNVGDPSATLEILADNVIPDVTLNAIPATAQLSTRVASGQWQATLSGTAVDHHSGLPANGVEVLLQGQGAAVGNGWQPATLNERNWTINYLFADGLPDPTGAYTVSVRAVDNVGNRTADNAATGILRLDVTGPAIALSAENRQRPLISEPLTISGVVTDTGIAGVDKVEVAFVPIEQIAVLPPGIGDDSANAQLNRTWLPATMTQRGATVSAWSFPIPTGLENEYQIDLRATDMLGNILHSDKVWRGVIDTLAPRVTASAAHLNGPYVYPNHVECSATDRYIDESKFVCPIYNGRPPQRSFDTNPALQALFPDRTILTGLSNSHTYWSPLFPSPFDVTACDFHGHCTTVNSGPAVVIPGAMNNAQAARTGASLAGLQSPVSVTADPPSDTLAAVVSPAPDNVIASDGVLNVTVAAESSALIKEVAVHLDDNIVQTFSFAQDENATRVLRTFQLTGLSEGQHTFVARATDWAGGVQNTDIPVIFTVDRQPPTVTINPATLTNADTWAPGSDILRFKGTATDAIGLAAVQIREGNGVFVDVEFGDGVWQTALPVTDPEGRTLNIVVRAIDLAGRISEVTQTIGTDLSGSDAPDTTITSSPANPSDVNTATFEFTGATPSGSTEVAFECQLDVGAFTACASPWAINDLSKSEHIFRVRAIDAAGNVDLTPASFTWAVGATALDATITASPGNPDTSRDASFSFIGTGTGFECSLDGAAFTACTTPVSYPGLSYGAHNFEVRARNEAGQTGAAAAYTWTIVNTPPVAVDQNVTTNAGAEVALVLAASDVDPLTYQVINQPAHGVLAGVAPDLIYLPDSTFSGVDSFTFQASDGQDASNLATVTITVQAGPDTVVPVTSISLAPPEASGQNGWYNTAVVVAVSASDGSEPNASGVAETRCVLNPGSEGAPAPASFDDLPAECPYLGAGAAVTGDGRYALYAASRDQSGNLEAPVGRAFQIDQTPPVVTVTGVSEGGVYPLDAAPTPGCDTQDALADVAIPATVSISGGAGDGTGSFTATCNGAVDNAGNQAQPVSVSYTVQAAPPAATLAIVVLGQEGVRLSQRVTVHSGAVVANTASTGPFLDSGVELSIGQQVTFLGDSSAYGDSVKVDQRSVLPALHYNHLQEGQQVSIGARVTPLSLPVVDLPPFLAGSPGSDPVTVTQNGSLTLAPGSYGAFTVGQRATVLFNGGEYHFASWDVGQQVKLYFQAPSQIFIAGQLAVGQQSVVAPHPSAAGLGAKDIVLYVTGANGTDGSLNASPKAAAFGQQTDLQANVYAPNGTLLLGQRANLRGAFLARWVDIGQQVNLTLESAFTTPLAVGVAGMASTPPQPVDEGAQAEDEGEPEEEPVMASQVYLPVVAR